MELNKTEWIGTWENFENYIYSEEVSMVETWEAAEEACGKHPVLARMFAGGCRKFWEKACDTMTSENPARIGGWKVSETKAGMEIEWFDTANNSLGKAEYVVEGMMEKGLEGKENIRLFAPDAREEWPFKCILAMEPMPKREEKLNGGLISHFHFQFGSRWEKFIEKDKLKNPLWYATMCDGDVNMIQKCNIVRALHRLPTI